MQFPKGVYVYGDEHFRGVCALEKQEIRTFFALLRNLHPHLGLIAIHVRNEGKLSGGSFQANIHKREGMVSGAADIIIPGNPSFVCELKRRDHTKSSLTEAQVDYLQACRAAGSFACVAFGADAAMKAVGKWLEMSKVLEAKVLERNMDKGISL